MLGPIQTKWVEALRSGLYKQGRCRLKTYDSYCCLGVACDILGVTSIDDCVCLPQNEVKTLGLRDAFGGFTNNSLSHMNDTGKSFEEIADFIEKNASVVFERVV